jgi:hypothetical protein
MLFGLLKTALINNNVPAWQVESNDLDWVVEIQAPRNGQPLRLIVNPRLNFDYYRAHIEDALRKGSFTYCIDVPARTYIIVH